MINTLLESLKNPEHILNLNPSLKGSSQKLLEEMSLHLQRYFGVYTQTQNKIGKLQTQINIDHNIIDLHFNMMRREIDAKQQQLKADYTNLYSNYETSLKEDNEYLANKCQSLSNIINSFTQGSQSSKTE